MSAEVDGIYLARDAYDSWKRRVKRARKSVRVFTPYFDSMLHRLLANAVVGVDNISVVTDLSPESGALQYRRQLIGARALLKSGIELRSLPRLHAKVLICDAETITVGSQNFTSYSRQSKETTSLPTVSVAKSTLLATLDEWYSTATAVSLELVEMLLKQLEQPARELQAAKAALVAAFDAQWAAYVMELEQEQLRREAAARRLPTTSQLTTAVRRSAQHRTQSEVWAQLRRAGGWYGHQTLKVSGTGDLTSWPARKPGNGYASLTLVRLNMYPLILNPSGRMAFARVGQHRISYVRPTVRFTTAKTLFGEAYEMTASFPDDGLDEANVHIALAVPGEVKSAELQLKLHVDGLDIALTSWQVDRGQPIGQYWIEQADRQAAQLELLATRMSAPKGIHALIRAAFESFKFSYLGIDDRNAASFFPDDWVRISGIEIADRPVLVVTPHKG